VNVLKNKYILGKLEKKTVLVSKLSFLKILFILERDFQDGRCRQSLDNYFSKNKFIQKVTKGSFTQVLDVL
jgi:hypothetical protein